MRILSLGFALLIISSVVQSSFAQPVQLDLKTVISQALKNNTTVKKAQDAVDAQSSNIMASYNDILPSLSFTGGYSRTNQYLSTYDVYGPTGIPINIGPLTQTTNDFNLSFNGNITLFNGFANYEKVDNAKIVKKRLESDLLTAKQNVVFQILTDYITALKNNKIVEIDSLTLVDARAQLASIQGFVDVGMKTLADLYRQDAIVATDELTLEQARNTFNKSIVDMVFDANMQQNPNYTISTKEFPTDLAYENLQDYVARNSNTDILVNMAIQNRKDYKSDQQNIDALKVSLDITRSTLVFPTLSGYGEYTLSGNNVSQINNSRVFTVGLTLSYPIFEGFSLENQRELAIINIKMAKEDLEQLKSQIADQMAKAVFDIKSLLKQVEITDRGLKSSEQDKITAEESYKVGLTTLLDVNTAEINYNNALISKANVIYDFQLAQKELQYLEGVLNY